MYSILCNYNPNLAWCSFCPWQSKAASPCVFHPSSVIPHPSCVISRNGGGVSPCVHQHCAFSSVFLVYVSANWVLIDWIATWSDSGTMDDGWWTTNGGWWRHGDSPVYFLWRDIFDRWRITDTWRRSFMIPISLLFSTCCLPRAWLVLLPQPPPPRPLIARTTIWLIWIC